MVVFYCARRQNKSRRNEWHFFVLSCQQKQSEVITLSSKNGNSTVCLFEYRLIRCLFTTAVNTHKSQSDGKDRVRTSTPCVSTCTLYRIPTLVKVRDSFAKTCWLAAFKPVKCFSSVCWSDTRQVYFCVDFGTLTQIQLRSSRSSVVTKYCSVQVVHRHKTYL